MAVYAKLFGDGSLECIYLDETKSPNEISINDKGLLHCKEVREDSDVIKFDATTNILHVSEISEVTIGG